MKRTALCAILAALAFGGVVTPASDRVAVYAKVDRVVLEPSADAPNTIQIWGVFSIATPPNPRNYRPDDYQPATRGYLYYAISSNAALARREWSDLKNVAGTGTIVGLGSRWESVPRLRQASDPPANPDPYALNAGLTKVQGRTDYPPIRALLDFAR